MLVHELFQEQVLHERAVEVTRARPQARRQRESTTPSFLKTLLPAITHGLAGVPAPPRTAGGC